MFSGLDTACFLVCVVDLQRNVGFCERWFVCRIRFSEKLGEDKNLKNTQQF